MIQILFFLALMLPGDILVLKSGKAMRCESYERKGNNVLIKRKGDILQLPANAINWEATQKAKDGAIARAKAKAAQKEQPSDLGGYYAEATKDKKLVNMTDETLGRQGYVGPQKVILQYRQVNNSIIVPVMINDQGPFDFILDTGASMTLITSELAQRLDLKHLDHTIGITGVGGSGTAELYSANTIGINGGKVRDLFVAVAPIPDLQNGLLGQDYLNHFNMSLDPGTKTLVLKPQYVPRPSPRRQRKSQNNSSLSQSDAEAAVDDFKAALHTLQSDVLPSLNSATNAFLNSGYLSQSYRKELREIDSQLSDIQSVSNNFSSIVEEFKYSDEYSSQADLLRSYSACVDRFNRFLSSLERHLHSLRGADSSASEIRQRRVLETLNEANSSASSLGGC